MFRRKSKKQKLIEAARNNDIAGIAQHFMPRDAAYEACLAAIDARAAVALQAVLEKNSGFDFAFSSGGDSVCARNLIAKANASADANALLAVLLAANNNYACGRQPLTSFLTPATSFETLQNILETMPRAFGDVLTAAGLADTAKLKFILSFTPKDGSAQKTLDAALIDVAGEGAADKAGLLLKHGANANYAAALALTRAAQNGHFETVALLLPHVDLALYGMDIAVKAEHADPDMAQLIGEAAKIALEQQNAEKPAEPPAALPPGALPPADILIETLALPDGGTLTTLFNFSTKQQHSIVKTAEGAVALAVVGFKDLDADVLAAARGKCAARNAPHAEKKPRRSYENLKKAGL
ncbi:MAG: hypothetical protein KGL10_05905 [Alphaproteobacteria bacterium]|nr:hypothetical protein [Alphaproteobacteria bacterium]MDE2336828.1 hypothetical protein [Alphaproteobacteria bacterium]